MNRVINFSRQIRTTSILFLLLVFYFAQVGHVQALSEEQKRIIDSGVRYFNASEDLGCVEATTLAGSTNEEKVWNYLITNMGLNAVQAAGIMGNIQAESGFDPLSAYPSTKSATPPGGTAWGIIQWTEGRQQALVRFAQGQGKDPALLEVQLDYMKSELEGPYKARVLDPIKASNDLTEVTRIWLENYEAPCKSGSQECAVELTKRTPFSLNWLSRFGSVSPSSSGDSVCGGSSGQIVGGLSLPVDRHWYDEHKEWFTKPHHDYSASDIPVQTGTPVYSMSAGTIISVTGVKSDCGIGIIINAGNGIQFTYCHSSDGGTLSGAREGDHVTAGQLIMHSNDTGNSTGPHLHVEIELNGANLCPQSLFVGIAEGTPPDITTLPRTGCSYGTNKGAV